MLRIFKVKELHPKKALLRMLVTESGMLMLFRDMHLAKAQDSMLVIESEMLMR